MVFDVTEKLNNFTSEPYVKYLEIIRSNNSRLYYDMNGNIVVDDQRITPPVIKNVQDEIDRLKVEKTKLYTKYFDIYTSLLSSTDPAKLQSVYDNVIADISIIDTNIHKLYLYHDLVNKSFDVSYHNLKNECKILLDKMGNYNNNKHTTSQDSKEYVKLFVKAHNKMQLLKDMKTNQSYINFYIDKTPVFGVSGVALKKPTDKIIAEKPINNVTKKKAPKTLSPKQVNAIKDNGKKLLYDKFKFGNKQECISLKRSQPYYMSLKKILEVIENNEDIKNKMPPKYKTLPKEKLCEYIFF